MPSFTVDADQPPNPPSTLIAIVGVLLVTGGAFGWSSLRCDLGEADIIVSPDGRFYPGTRVDGPFSAYAQAEVLAERIDELKGSEDAAVEVPEEVRRRWLVDEESTRTKLLTGVLGFSGSVVAIIGGLSFVTIGLRTSGRAGRIRSDGMIGTTT